MDRGKSLSTHGMLERLPVSGKMDDLPRVRSVKPGKLPWTLELVWHDGSRNSVDLTGLVHRSRHFRRFLDEPLAFRKVKAVEWGAGIGWDNGLDYSAATLKTLAEEQQPLTGRDLQTFEASNKLNTAETAALLDVSERTIREYRAAVRLPQPVALALRAMLTNTAVLDAHYRPSDRRPRGRPKKSALA